ncbi:MAG: MFS transporter [Nitrososphaerota archaeon]|jgi:MFS family permease|nr:MFS transporter [Nitrososphaerota archaeon]MDG6903762.1 MFS transporter [Nitrososphaerota archaeon]MDG6911605.1 MFS transporter [Nitrososphaerota archaeon]MDG6960820.1 MFS transporter [Nitrososphaerota archaeon]MDG7028732.1 MFS transporter [Nitrososphaerota archaeon]
MTKLSKGVKNRELDSRLIVRSPRHTTQGMPTSQRPSYLKVLSNRPFFSLWFGQLVSVSGDAIFDVALLWLVLTTTGSIFLVGITQAVIFLPTVIVAPIAGVYVDRFNRQTTMVVSNVVQGGVVAAISFLYFIDELPFPALLALIFVLYSFSRFFYAATKATIPRLVQDHDNLTAANSLFSLTTSFNQFASYAVGGLIIALLGVDLPITYDSITFFFAAAMFMLIPKHLGEMPVHPDSVQLSPSRRSFRADFTEGLRYFLSSRLLVELAILAAVVNLSLGGVFALLAPYAKFWVNGDSSTYGFILAAFSLGLFLGAYVVGKLRNTREYVGKLQFAGVFAVGTIIAFVGLSTTQFLAIALIFTFGFVLSVLNVPLQALFQAIIPQEVFGRVITVIVALLSIAQPLSAAVSGYAATVFSIGEVFIAFGFLAILVSVVGYLTLRELRLAKY